MWKGQNAELCKKCDKLEERNFVRVIGNELKERRIKVI